MMLAGWRLGWIFSDGAFYNEVSLKKPKRCVFEPRLNSNLETQQGAPGRRRAKIRDRI
jgi:hypothetical protein